MPDAVVRARKDGATDEDIVELLGDNLDRASYENYECGDKGANASCYAQVTYKYSSPISSVMDDIKRTLLPWGANYGAVISSNKSNSWKSIFRGQCFVFKSTFFSRCRTCGMRILAPAANPC